MYFKSIALTIIISAWSLLCSAATAFVLRFRTKEEAAPGEPLWQRPLQDTQRVMRLIRHEAERWQLQTVRIGILGFSAGGQVGTIAHSRADQASYQSGSTTR